jgi:lipopolysaccharide heptosyltransferase II
MRHALEYWAVAGVRAIVTVLPAAAVRGLGSALGLAFYALDRPHRRVALSNLAECFPARSERERRRIARHTFRHFGQLLLELLRFSALDERRRDTLVEIEGAEHVRDAYRQGRGVLFFTGHFGFWELHAIHHGRAFEPVGVLARALDNPRLNQLLEQIRGVTGNQCIYRQGAVRKVLRTLAHNHGVAMLIDQHMHSPDAIWVDFFQRPAATTSTLATLALRTGAPVVPVFALPLRGGRFRFVYEPPVEPPDGDSPDQIRAFTQRCTDVLEMYVRRHPHLWLWMHRRWRDAPAPATRGMFPTVESDDEDTNGADEGGDEGTDERAAGRAGGGADGEARAGARERVVILAPNWLGDAVMALPAVGAIRRHFAHARLTVAARESVAPLFTLVDGVDDVLTLQGGGGLGALSSWRADATTLASGRFDLAVMFPNAFAAAFMAWQAGIPERWGVAADARSRLLTRAVPRPRAALHQATYYRALVTALGIEAAPLHASVRVPALDSEMASRLGAVPYVVLAPGAAYGRAKQWPPDRCAELASMATRELGLRVVLIGSRADGRVCQEIIERARRAGVAADSLVDLSGGTTLPDLTAILARAHAVVTNDSGAMHLAAAAGARVVATFGATNERRTAPLTRDSRAPAPVILTSEVWCRPCLLRECPIDHRCLTRIDARRVADVLGAVPVRSS